LLKSVSLSENAKEKIIELQSEKIGVTVPRVVIGASSAVVRTTLASVLTDNPALQLIGSFSVDKAFARLEDLQPDVVLLDLGSPPDEAMSIVLESREPSGAALVILTDDFEKSSAADVIRSGVHAILPREAKPEEILAAIQASLTGLVAIHPDALDALLSTDAENQPDLDPSDQILTPREIEVLRMIAEGLGNKEIAAKLRISDHTVKFHISSTFAKLGASNRAEAVTLGIRLGLIML
jgi:NarL family two-component system response regulator YdfI